MSFLVCTVTVNALPVETVNDRCMIATLYSVIYTSIIYTSVAGDSFTLTDYVQDNLEGIT